MKYFLTLFLLPVFLYGFLYSLISCKGAGKEVGMAIYNMNDPYINTFARQIETLSEDLLNISSYNAKNSQMLQNENIEEMINQKSDLLIINPVDRLGVYPIIRSLSNFSPILVISFFSPADKI